MTAHFGRIFLCVLLLCGSVAEAQERGPETNLPIPAIDNHAERWTTLQQAYVETGATLMHLIRARVGY